MLTTAGDTADLTVSVCLSVSVSLCLYVSVSLCLCLCLALSLIFPSFFRRKNVLAPGRTFA